MFDERIRITSHKTSDIVLLILLWVQLALGLITMPLSCAAPDGSMMMIAGRLGAAHPDPAR